MALVDNITAFWNFGDAITSATLVDASGNGQSLTPYLRIGDCTAIFTMGSNASASPGQFAYASLKGWGVWHRLFTADEKTLAATAGTYYSGFTQAMKDDCKAYYLLDEAGGSSSYADATGRGNTLSVGGSGATVRVNGPAGVGDNATKLIGTNDLFRNNPGDDLQSKQRTTTIAGWVSLQSKPSGPNDQQCFWGQLVNSSEIFGKTAYFAPASDRFCSDGDAGDTAKLNQGVVTVEASTAPTLNQWYYLILEYDITANVNTISVDNGTATSIGPILQPTVVSGKIGSGSKFYNNPEFTFGPPGVSGWDYSPDHYVVGNGRATVAAAAATQFGSTAKTVWGWYKASDTNTYQTLLGYFSQHEVDWVVQLFAHELYLVMGHDQAFVKVAVPHDDNTWHLFTAWRDSGANKIKIRLDNGTTQEATGPTTPQTISSPLCVGCDGPTDFFYTHAYTGALNIVGVATGIPDASDLATLWNGGAGFSLSGPDVLSCSPSSGTTAGGTPVTVTGTDFQEDAVVTIGGTEVATTFVNATTLTITTPAHAAGAVDVSVAQPSGSDTLTNGYTYVAPPSPGTSRQSLSQLLAFNRFEALTPSNTVDLARLTDGIFVGEAGTLAVVQQNGTVESMTAVAGQVVPVMAKRINSTGTTATGLLACYFT